MMNFRPLNTIGFTLIELIMVIVIIGILSAFAAPKIMDTIKESKIQATKSELQTLKDAIMGDPESTVGGQMADKGYFGDVGSMPPQSDGLDALVTQPSGVSNWDPFDQTGWNGPYINTEGSNDWKEDAWGNTYVYSENDETITSYGPNGQSGGGDDITINLQN